MRDEQITFVNELGNTITVSIETPHEQPHKEFRMRTLRMIGPTSETELIMTDLELENLYDLFYLSS